MSKQPDYIDVQDTRKNIDPRKRLHSKIPKDRLRNLIKEAINEGIDPNVLLAVGMKESNLGSRREGYYGVNGYPAYTDTIGKQISQKRKEIFDKYGFTIMNDLEKYNYPDIIKAEKKFGVDAVKKDIEEFLDLREKESTWSKEISSWSDEKLFAKTLKYKMDYAKRLGYNDELFQIQAYNGLGYNDDYGVDMKKNPIYGKQIQDLKENVIKKNPEIQDFIKSIGSDSIYNQIKKSPTSFY